jgi:hypothetical protein
MSWETGRKKGVPLHDIFGRDVKNSELWNVPVYLCTHRQNYGLNK